MSEHTDQNPASSISGPPDSVPDPAILRRDGVDLLLAASEATPTPNILRGAAIRGPILQEAWEARRARGIHETNLAIIQANREGFRQRNVSEPLSPLFGPRNGRGTEVVLAAAAAAAEILEQQEQERHGEISYPYRLCFSLGPADLLGRRTLVENARITNNHTMYRERVIRPPLRNCIRPDFRN